MLAVEYIRMRESQSHVSPQIVLQDRRLNGANNRKNSLAFSIAEIKGASRNELK